MNFNLWKGKRKIEEREEYQDMINSDLLEKLADLEKKYALFVANTPSSTAEFSDRIADLEVKMAKLWAVLIKIDARGNENASKFARRTFGGKGL